MAQQRDQQGQRAGNGAVRLISHEGGRFHLTAEGSALLNSLEGELSVTAIIGPYRHGKSYLMSRLAGEQNLFPLGHTVNACTKGVWAYALRRGSG